ncbi:MAG: hypothetical protein DYG93_09035 [Leptolyngbya sp. PLA2]|nr:hypothetical protein [Leptolyngbya sp.]MCE7971790.1 hypothetical protein [Leptolyngbya sp. PL-A2]MCZ7634432.1 hypothetical protein [Phycisphaerales bacterium]MDL1904771.1 hypothetical protein [Synechococcales cyanobacterium CNB]GIK19747.1 MAG: hypothetical protein BroJett004_19110 [Planctomycetota bacterium]
MAQEADRLREFLAERDEPCPSCGYNLRGLAGRACPECGLGLTLRVGLAEPATGTLIATIVGLALGVGWSFSFLALMVGISLWEGSWPPGIAFVVPIATLIVLGAQLLFLARAKGRAVFRRRTPAERLWACFFAWTIFLGSLLLFAISLMHW